MSAIVSARTSASKTPAPASHAAWVGTPTGYRTLRHIARKFKGLAMAEVDDLTSELALAILESENHPDGEAQSDCAPWLEGLAHAVASRMRNERLAGYAVPLGDSAGRVEDQSEDEAEPPFARADDMQRFLDTRRRRIARVLAKLPPAQQRAVKARYFRNENLAQVARDTGRCDSAERTNLWKAHRKLRAMVTADGYAVLAA